MSAAFTPGPWQVDKRQDYGDLRGLRIREVARNFVVAVAIADTHELWLDRDHNARLIAAAPDMFSVLEWLLSPDFDERDMNARIADVIAKAVGQ